jgi:ubiquinone/menaquinone biosynthesis C-methylase UbiE
MPEPRLAPDISQPMAIADASQYDALYSGGHYMSGSTDVFEYCRLKTIHSSLHELARHFSPKSILDVGCGQGRCLEIAQGYFPQSRLLGLDFSEVALKAARKRLPDGVFYHGSCEELDAIPDQTADLILNIEVLEHVVDARKTVGEFARVLKPGGVILVTTPCANRLSLEWSANFVKGNLQRMPDGFGRFGTDPPEHARRLTSKDLGTLMRDAGFTQDWIRFRAHFFTWPSYLASRRVRGHLRAFGEMAYLDWRLFRWLPNGASMIGQFRKLPA